MIIGQNAKDNDLDVNPLKAKQLTNIRTTSKDEAVRLTPDRADDPGTGDRLYRGRRAGRSDAAEHPPAQARARVRICASAPSKRRRLRRGLLHVACVARAHVLSHAPRAAPAPAQNPRARLDAKVGHDRRTRLIAFAHRLADASRRGDPALFPPAHRGGAQAGPARFRSRHRSRQGRRARHPRIPRPRAAGRRHPGRGIWRDAGQLRLSLGARSGGRHPRLHHRPA